MARYSVYYDSNDGHHRWLNLQRCRVGFRWLTGTSVEGTKILMRKSRVLFIERRDG